MLNKFTQYFKDTFILLGDKYVLLAFRVIILLLIIFFALYGSEGMLKEEEIDVLLIRWLFIVAGVQFLSNGLLFAFGASRTVTISLFFFDLSLISLVLYWTQGFNTDLFLVYLLVIFTTIIFKKPVISFLIGSIACILYAFLFFATHPFSEMMDPSITIRFPLLLIVAFFSSVIAQNVETEKVTLEKFSKNLENLYKRIVETSEEGICIIDQDVKITFVSPKAAALLGYKPEEMLRQSLFAFMSMESQANADLRFNNFRQGELKRYDFQLIRKDGKPIWTLCATNPIFNEYDKNVGTLVMISDVTMQKKIQAQLTQLQKMEAVSRLAGGIAHDFNNILMVIQGSADLLSEELGRKYDRLEDIKKVTGRATDLIRQLMTFSRIQITQPNVIELNNSINNVKKILAQVIGEDIELQTNCASDVGRIKAEAVQVEQVLMNLAVNARDAMPKGGKLIIETANITVQHPQFMEQEKMEPGHYVLLSVADTGTGMSEDVKAHIFEPFFTTKTLGQGTGLGLSMVYGIVKQSNGYIEVLSQPNQGTKFNIYFPQMNEPAKPPAPAAAPASTTRNGGSILLVEDEDSTRKIIRHMLELHGYIVIEASDVNEALVIGKQSEKTIDLLLTDMVMPGLSGIDLSEQFRSLRPGIKIVFMSGYADEAIKKKTGNLNLADMNLLTKPFSAQDLYSKIEQVLRQSS